MADLARSAVTFNREWTEGRNRSIFVRDVTCVLTGQGGATNKILASVLGFLEIYEVTAAIKSDNGTAYVANPSYTGNMILLGTTPADVTATVRMMVKGRTL